MPTQPPVFHDLSALEDSRDVIHQAVAVIASGRKIAIVNRSGLIRTLSGLSRSQLAGSQDNTDSISFLIHHLEAFRDWLPESHHEIISRLVRKAWPDLFRIAIPNSATSQLRFMVPTEIFDTFQALGYWAFESPSSGDIRQLMTLVAGPILQTTSNPGIHIVENHNICENFPIDSSCDMVLLDDSKALARRPATVLIGNSKPEILDPGDLGEERIRWIMDTRILFVCTGNTCRSPMAEALCKALVASHLNCSPDDLQARGIDIQSAGVSAGDGYPASVESIIALDQRGDLLESHQSQQVYEDLLLASDLIYAMTGSHRDLLLMHFPELANRVELLDPDETDIPDPYGQSQSVYRHTAQAIENAILQRIKHWDFIRPE